MIRKLIDYKKLDHNLAAQLIQTYPDGYGDEDIIIFKNIQGEIIETVELKTNDTIYLVKISTSLANFISNFEDNIEKGLDSHTVDTVEIPMPPALELHPEERRNKQSK
jgi:NADPH-dependent curcumin reductase CurA